LESEATLLFFSEMEDRLEALPNVTQATTSLMLPAAGFGTTTLLLGGGIDGVDRPTEIPWNYVSQGYFDVLGIPLLHGRLFEEADFQGPTLTVVSAAFARTYWGRTDVVGETYRSEGNPDDPREIIGVVGDVAVRALGEPPTPSLYWPLNFAYPRVNLVMQVEGSTSDALAASRRVLREADARLMILAASDMGEHLGDTLERQRLVGALLSGLGVMALLLAMLGVYGVVSFAVSRRKREVGIRIALGAARESVVRLIVRDVVAVVLVGSLLGVALSIPAGRLVGQLFTGSGTSPATTVGVCFLLILTSLVATMVPALRAARTDPIEALRQE